MNQFRINPSAKFCFVIEIYRLQLSFDHGQVIYLRFIGGD